MRTQEETRSRFKRSLHNELCIVRLADIEFTTSLYASHNEQQLQITCRDGHGEISQFFLCLSDHLLVVTKQRRLLFLGLFQMSADQEPISFVRLCTADNPLNEKEEGFDWPR